MGKKFFLSAAVLAVLGSLGFFYPVRILSLAVNDQVVFFRVTKAEDTFRLGYRHSVVLSEVWDTFTIGRDFEILLTETRFQGQGAGLPSTLAAGETWHREGREFRITGMRRAVAAISWRVEKKWENRFQFGAEPEIDFSSRWGDGLVEIRVRKISGWEWMRLVFQESAMKLLNNKQ
jgi:hypothetical protein